MKWFLQYFIILNRGGERMWFSLVSVTSILNSELINSHRYLSDSLLDTFTPRSRLSLSLSLSLCPCMCACVCVWMCVRMYMCVCDFISMSVCSLRKEIFKTDHNIILDDIKFVLLLSRWRPDSYFISEKYITIKPFFKSSSPTQHNFITWNHLKT